MARKRSTPKPAEDSPASIPFPGELPDDVVEMLSDAASLVGAVRLRRLALQRSLVVADPDGLGDEEANTLSMEAPDIEHDFDPEARRLRVSCHCRLTASRGTTAGRRKKKGADVPLLIVEAAFLLDYEVAPDAVAEIDDSTLDAFCDAAAISQAWPYGCELVRDASTRAGLPVIDVPFDAVF